MAGFVPLPRRSLLWCWHSPLVGLSPQSGRALCLRLIDLLCAVIIFKYAPLIGVLLVAWVAVLASSIAAGSWSVCLAGWRNLRTW